MIKYFFPAFLIFITCMSCTDYLGQNPVRVSDENKSWLPFDENDTILFTNSSNDTIVLIGRPLTRVYKFVTTNYNDETGDGYSRNYEFLTYTCMNSDSTISLSSELGFASDNCQQELIEYFKLKLIWDHSAASVSIIVSDNYLSWPYDVSLDSHKFLDTFDFEGHQYFHVYTTKNSGPYTLYYTKSDGIIGFIAKGKSWARIF